MTEPFSASEKHPYADIQGEKSPVVGIDQRGSEVPSETTPKYHADEAEKINLEEGGTVGNDGRLGDNESATSSPKEGNVMKAQDEDLPAGGFTGIWRRYRPWGHAIIWLLCTAYFHLL